MSEDACNCGCAPKAQPETTDECACGCECCGESSEARRA